MTLRLLGAGLPRTGTNSLKLALERLLGGRCYHMFELADRPEDAPAWRAALDGEPVDWTTLFEGCTAAVDWPVSAFWPELVAAHPGIPVVLSSRSDPDTWWRSMQATILQRLDVRPESLPHGHPQTHQLDILHRVMGRFCPAPTDRDALIESYERHNAAVRAGTPSGRLVDWCPGDGWEPLCAALGVPVPDEPFPHVNTSVDFAARSRARMSGGAGGPSRTR